MTTSIGKYMEKDKLTQGFCYKPRFLTSYTFHILTVISSIKNVVIYAVE